MHNSTSSVDIASFGSRALPLQCSLSQRDFCLPFMCSGPNDQDADGATTTYHSWTVMTPMSFAALQRGASSEYLKGFVTGVIAISMFGQGTSKHISDLSVLCPTSQQTFTNYQDGPISSSQ